jgi:membrane-bound lytic murein transglycosylase C
MRGLLTAVMTTGLLVLGPVAAYPEDSVADAFDAIEKQMDAAMTAIDAQWEALVAAEEAAWLALQAEVEAKWDGFVGSTEKVWVDYSEDREVRSQVDYENGEVVVEALIPAEDVPVPDAEDALPVQLPPDTLRRVQEQVEKIAKPDTATGMGPVEDQVKTASGESLTPSNAKEFVQKEVAPKAVIEPGIIKRKDGTERRKARMVIPMIPRHLYVRAAKYKDLVLREAGRYDMEPQLVFAVIQTESYFNPRARSPAMAFGLMQLIPKHGAYEAIEFLEGKGKLVSAEYLYVPANNVRLGVTYLHLLNSRYYGKIDDPEKREVLVVASYNWGPTAVGRRIVAPVAVDELTAAELRQEVDARAPQETRDYVVRVTTRKPIYDGLVAP